MSSSSGTSESICKKLGVKPLTTQTFLYYYTPMQGVISYSVLSVNVMNPSLVIRLFPRRDITNILLLNSLLGSGLYLYSRPHMKSLNKQERILYSAFGAVSFSLGSVLIWAMLRSFLPENLVLGTVAGLGSGMAMIKLARSYVQHIDSLVPASK